MVHISGSNTLTLVAMTCVSMMEEIGLYFSQGGNVGIGSDTTPILFLDVRTFHEVMGQRIANNRLVMWYLLHLPQHGILDYWIIRKWDIIE